MTKEITLELGDHCKHEYDMNDMDGSLQTRSRCQREKQMPVRFSQRYYRKTSASRIRYNCRQCF